MRCVVCMTLPIGRYRGSRPSSINYKLVFAGIYATKVDCPRLPSIGFSLWKKLHRFRDRLDRRAQEDPVAVEPETAGVELKALSLPLTLFFRQINRVYLRTIQQTGQKKEALS